MAGHLTIIVWTGGGAFAYKNCQQGQAFDQFFQMPGGGGMLADGIDSHIISISFETDSLPYPGRGKDNDAKIGDFSSNFIAAQMLTRIWRQCHLSCCHGN